MQQPKIIQNSPIQFQEHTILLDFIDCLIGRFLRTDTAVCDNHQRLGNIGDGGWDICMVAPFKPIDPCVVYSFG